MNKVIRDGKVAVLVSPGFGAGWSTWADASVAEQMLFDPVVVAWVEGGKKGPVPLAHYGNEYVYDGGARDLEIQWISEGTRFVIDEYDGNESITFEDQVQWLMA